MKLKREKNYERNVRKKISRQGLELSKMTTKKTNKRKTKRKPKWESVIASSQTFREAGGELVRPRLVPVGMIRGDLSENYTLIVGKINARQEAEDELKYEAAREGCTHVYGCKIVEVECLVSAASSARGTFYFMEGDGYKPLVRGKNES
jgi:hypothetical protein